MAARLTSSCDALSPKASARRNITPSLAPPAPNPKPPAPPMLSPKWAARPSTSFISLATKLSHNVATRVASGGFSPNRFVQLVATAPAKLFGLYPQKGTIAVGSDADLIVFDPKREETISAKTHHMRVDYSMFEGIRTKGSPKLTMSRGRVIIENGKFTGRPGAGSFLRRKTYAAV